MQEKSFCQNCQKEVSLTQGLNIWGEVITGMTCQACGYKYTTKDGYHWTPIMFKQPRNGNA